MIPPPYLPIYCASLPHNRVYAVVRDGRWVCGYCGKPVAVAW